MKTLKITLILLMLTIAASAQTNFETAMKKGLAELRNDTTAAQPLKSANYFERIATAEPKEWLPLYYAGYCNMIVAMEGKQTAAQKDALYDKAMELAKKADQLSPKNSEIVVLMGYITFMKMAVDANARAMTMIGQANAYFDHAIALNPENPRAYFVKGQSVFYTPVAFGGGGANAKPLFIKALEKYNSDNKGELAPSWGKERCAYLLSQCK